MSRYRFGLLLTLAGALGAIVAFFSPWFDRRRALARRTPPSLEGVRIGVEALALASLPIVL
jgi:hypothetical protein